MTIIRWQPLVERETVQRQLNRLFDELTPGYETWRKRLNVEWAPAIELEIQPAAFLLRIQLPGIDPATVDVQVTRETVSLSGERQLDAKTADSNYIRSEFRYGKFHRMISLPAAVQTDQVKAAYTDGILTLTLPREQAVRPTVVKVNLSEPKAPEASDNLVVGQ